MANNLSSHTEAPTKDASFPPFQRDTFASQLIWLAISFVLLYALVARWGLPRVCGILEERRKHIADDVAEARRRRAETHSVMNAYESALDHSRNQAHSLIEKTLHKLKAQAKRHRHELELQFDARLSESERAIAVAKENAAADVRGIAIESARAIVVHLSGRGPPMEVISKAVDRALRR
jgi:F-type H+-transporting ATPase subunit b